MGAPRSQQLEWLRATAAGIAAIVAAFHPFWNHGIVFRDSLQTFAPYKALVARSLASGALTGWYPWSFLGMPFLGNVEAGWFYPLNLLYVALPFEPAHRLYILLHYPMAACFLGLFLRGRGLSWPASMFGGLAYALSGHLVCQHATVTMLIGAAWAPLALHLADRAVRGGLVWATGAGAVLAMQVFAGDLQTALVTALLVGGLCAVGALDRARRARALAALGVTALSSAMLAAVQLLPAWDLLRRTARGGGIGLGESTEFSFHPGRLVELVWATPFGALWPDIDFWGRFALDRSYDNPWSISQYVGGPVVALAALGIARSWGGLGRWTLAGAVVFLAIAFGRHAPVYGLLHAVVPSFDLFRYPEKFMAGFVGCVAIAAALGLDALRRDLDARPEVVGRRALIVLAAAAVALGIAALAWPPIVTRLTGQASGAPVHDAAIRQLVAGGLRFGLVNAGAAGLVWAASRRRLAPRVALTVLVAVLVVDWSTATVRRMPYGPPDLWDERPEVARLIAPEGRPPLGAYRVFREQLPFRDLGPKDPPQVLARQRIWERSTLIRNIDAMEGFEDVVGYTSSRIVDGLVVLRTKLSPRLLEILNVRYIVAPVGRRPLGSIRTEVAHEDRIGDFAIVRLVDARPRAYWASRVRVVRDGDEAASALQGPDASGLVVVEDEPGLTGPIGDGPAEIRPVSIEAYAPDRVVVTTEADREGWLVLSDRDDPGWTARLDGRVVPIRRANILVRGVAVPAGRHEVVFAYRAPGLVSGALISATAWLGALAWWVGAWRRPRRTAARVKKKPDRP